MTEAPEQNISVLVVDDENFMIKFTRRVLEQLGITDVVEASEGYEALEALKEKNVNLVITDLQMPKMDGIELMRHLSELEYPPSVILLSGEDKKIRQIATDLALAHGLDLLGTLAKPLKKENVAELIQKLGDKPSIAPKRTFETLSVEEVRDGIGAGCLVPVYQPKVSIKTGEFVGVETLARWKTSSGKILGPGAFVPIAEDNNLIDDLTKGIFYSAMKQASDWLIEGMKIKISVNVSVENLETTDFPHFIIETAEEFGVDPQQIILEVTETKIMADLKKPLEVLSRLRMKRIGLSIDDFGTGYSSMQQLQRAPFTELKVDRAFVFNAYKDIEKKAMLESSVDLGKRLELSVVAEGAESLEDWRLLEEVGADICQGYFVAKPLLAEEIPGWLEDWKEQFKDMQAQK